MKVAEAEFCTSSDILVEKVGKIQSWLLNQTKDVSLFIEKERSVSKME